MLVQVGRNRRLRGPSRPEPLRRWIFYVNAPVSLLAALLAWRGLPADPARHDSNLDLTGLLLLSPALAVLLYGLTQAGTRSGFDRATVVVPLAAGALLLAAFVPHALRSAHPLIDLRLFTTRSFAASSALLFLSGLAMFGAMLLLPLHYEQLRGRSVVTAGLLLAPQCLGSLLARGAGSISDRIGPRPVVLVVITPTALGALPFAYGGQHANGLIPATALVIRGAGLSAANMAVMVGAYRDLTPPQTPHAGSTTRITQQVGGSFGAAVLAVILQGQLASHPGVAGQEAAFDHTFNWALSFTALAVFPALFLPGLPHKPARPASGRNRDSSAPAR
ncbi:MFS transporter [Streptomyces sp. NPDC048417]|uniref:MFS transporter n=1 Tax=Streptomyces sp. NPDC048417 TaxID=3155387 RepID=UPI003440ADEA